ncbi:unnamed protein product [marine sediment metagenome]|uniref:LITAF domain-containing protein n=1 Tax=marine sediment metagenome TaxID=412755 RepID=X1H455_9ZZZZ
MTGKIKIYSCGNCGAEIQVIDETNYFALVLSVVALSIACFAVGYIL